jgi:hypothetical protein
LSVKLKLEPGQIVESNPVDAVHRTGLDRFLDAVTRVTILTNGPGAAEMGLNHKRVGGHMGAVATTDASSFIHPDSFRLERASKHGL